MSQQVHPFGVLYFPPAPPSAPTSGYPGANRLSLVPVRDVMCETTVEWINADNTCTEAAMKMLERNVGLLPVKEAQSNYLIGVITDRDLIVRVAAKGLNALSTPVAHVMTSPILAMIYDDADLMAAERLMIDRSVRRLLVLRRQDNVVLGILSVDDFARAGQRRRAGEVIRGAASLAVSPETARKGGVKPIGEVPAVDTGTEVHSSIFKVRDIMSGSVECVFENDTCSDAAARMLNRAVGCLPVCAGDPTSKALSGIVTDRDIVVRAMATGKDLRSTLVRFVMSKNVACCFADDNLAAAEKIMMDRCVRRLPVIQRGTCELVGMLSVDDIALSASRGRAGRVIEHAAAKPNEVYMSTSAASAMSAKPGQQA